MYVWITYASGQVGRKLRTTIRHQHATALKSPLLREGRLCRHQLQMPPSAHSSGPKSTNTRFSQLSQHQTANKRLKEHLKLSLKFGLQISAATHQGLGVQNARLGLHAYICNEPHAATSCFQQGVVGLNKEYSVLSGTQFRSTASSASC